MLAEILIFVTFILVFSYHKITKKWYKFQQRGLPYSKPYFPFGSIHNWKLMFAPNVSSSEQYKVYMDSPLMKEKMFGVYGHADRDECLMVNDLEIAKRMLIKDFDHFVDRTDLGIKFNDNNEYDQIWHNMFIFQKGDSWKTQRSMMSPVFTTGKLKLMFPLLQKIGEQMENFVSEKAQQNQALDSKEIFAKFALDGIATSAFGIDINTFKDDQNTFVKMVNEVMRGKGSESGSGFGMFKFLLAFFLPISTYLFTPETFSFKGTKFLRDSLVKTIQMRKQNAGARKRNDIIDLVINLQENGKGKNVETAPEDEFDKDASLDMSTVKNNLVDMESTLVSSAFLLFIAALDTTSTSLTFAIHYLIKYPYYQDKIREEINEIIGDTDKATFEQIQSLKFLEKFLLETLRLSHPFGNILERECTKDYPVPGTNYVVRKGEVVNFSCIFERMKSENESFAHGGEFNPENFDPSNKPDSFSYLAFGQGPRNCIGKRYAILTMKLALVHILTKYKITKTENSKDELRLYKFLSGADVPFYAVPVKD